MSLWLQRLVSLFTAAHSDAYQQGVEDARNVVERVALMPWRSPSMDAATLQAWRDCADYIAGRLNDLLAARVGTAEVGRPGSERGEADIALLLLWLAIGGCGVWFWWEFYQYGQALIGWSFTAR